MRMERDYQVLKVYSETNEIIFDEDVCASHERGGLVLYFPELDFEVTLSGVALVVR